MHEVCDVDIFITAWRLIPWRQWLNEGKVEWDTSCKQDYSASELGCLSLPACQVGDIMWCIIYK